MKNSLKFGAIGGILASILFFIAYFIKPNLAFNTIISFIVAITMVLIMMFKALSAERFQLGGRIKFGEALICGLITYAVFTFIITMVQYLFLVTSETAFGHMVTETKRVAIWTMELMGASEDKIMEQGDTIDREMIQDGFGILQTFANLFVSILFPGAPLAIIAAAIVSRKKAQV